jgi:hypothetical protein
LLVLHGIEAEQLTNYAHIHPGEDLEQGYFFFFRKKKTDGKNLRQTQPDEPCPSASFRCRRSYSEENPSGYSTARLDCSA